MAKKQPKPKKVRNGEVEHLLLKYFAERIGGPLDGFIFVPLHPYAYAQQPAFTISPRLAGILVARRGVAPVRGVACEHMINWNIYFMYNPKTGDLIWKERTPSTFKHVHKMASWNAKFAGRVAGTINKRGYTYVVINCKGYLAHRIVWEMHFGEIPKKMFIDHIDGAKRHNRIRNLRLATKAQNGMNRGKTLANTSGFKGVHWDPVNNKWVASIYFHGKGKNLGRFDTPEEAHEAYCNAARKYHGKFFQP